MYMHYTRGVRLYYTVLSSTCATIIRVLYRILEEQPNYYDGHDEKKCYILLRASLRVYAAAP
jgi:hypothetical protein